MEHVINSQVGLLQRGKRLILPLLFVTALLLGVTNTWAEDDGPVTLLHVIPIPGFSDATHPASFDVGWTDSGKFYFSDRGPTTGGYPDCGGRVDIIDAKHDIFEGSICGFVGNQGPSSVSGPGGLLVLHRHGRRELWAGDGNSTVKVVDPDAQVIVDTISTGGTKRADELAYDSKHHIIMITNPDEDTPQSPFPFLTFISQETHAVMGRLVFDGVSAPLATDGLEQPVFDKSTKKFYQALPETPENPGGEIDVIDPVARQVTDRFPLENCAPHGLTVGPRNHNHGHNLLAGCSKRTPTSAVSIVLDDTNGNIVATITQVGGSDEVWFNKGDNRYYLAAGNCPVGVCGDGGPGVGGAVLGVIDAETNQWLQNVHTATGAHIVAVNPRNNHIFVPRGPRLDSGFPADQVGVAVYGHNGDDD